MSCPTIAVVIICAIVLVTSQIAFTMYDDARWAKRLEEMGGGGSDNDTEEN